MHVEGVLANNDYILNGCYIEITSNCNLRCIHCYNESGELRDQISVEAFKNVLGCYDNPKKASITLSGGEPLLHPQVWKFIDMMLESGILARNILLITNATCITDDVANMLAEKHVSVQVSLNGSRAELHDSICGKGNFERTMAGLQRLLSKHANMVIVRNMMNKQNMNDNWDMFCEKLIDMGVHKINIKEDFLVNIIDISTISSWLFAQVDGMVTLIILGIFAMMSLINSNYRVLQVLLAMVIGGAGTISYLAFNYDALQLPTLYWLFLQSLSLYIVYLSFQTLFFERFIACFKIKGNVGFFIATIDFIGYTGTVCVLLFKEFCSPDINWMEFYNQFSGWVGIVCSIAFIGSAIYLMQRYKLEKQLRKEEKNKKIIVSPMALTNLKETAENICNP